MDSSVEAFTSQTSVAVSHNLGYKPPVWIEDSNGRVIYAGENHASDNQFTITFARSQSGTIHYQDILTSTSTVTVSTEDFTNQTYVLVQHNLTFKPNVWITDTSGNRLPFIPIDHISNNAFAVTFENAQSGTIHYKDFIFNSVGFTRQDQLEIIHGLGYKPETWFMDSDGVVFSAQVDHTTINKFECVFEDAETGTLFYGDVEYDYDTNVYILRNVTVLDADLRNVFPDLDAYLLPEWTDFAKPILQSKKALYRKLQQVTGKDDDDMADIRDLKTEEMKSRIVMDSLVRIFIANRNFELARAYTSEKLAIPMVYHDDTDGDVVVDEGERAISQLPVFSR